LPHRRQTIGGETIMSTTMQLTTSQFTNAISRHIDESKPDPLAKSQIENLYVNWKQQQQQQQQLLDCVDDCGDSSANKTSMCGTLILSSEYISVSIHVLCHWKKINHQRSDGEYDEKSCDARNNNSNGDVVIATTKQFQEELFIKLTASATESTVRSTTSEDTTKQQQDRKDRRGSKKLHTEMLKRLRSDYYIRQLLFVDDDDGALPILLCEALIQQNLRSEDSISGGNNSSSDDIHELEERVNVEEGTLQGIKNAIFSKSEDNLDVLDLLLNMPYLPRSSSAAASNEWPSKLADRAYLRLLEDGMIDACEKEGEDDLLDDLNISDANHYQQRTAGKPGEEGKKNRNASSKRMRK
jgi:hypothetical protein